MSQSNSESADRPRRVLLGVSAGIAAYKAPELVRRMRERGWEVRVAMTDGATRFIAPLTLQAVSGHRAHVALLDEQAEAGMGHIELARWADDVVIAPATADLIGRLALGLADDLLTTTLLATEARLWVAPAMNRTMWAQPAVAENVARLERRGARVLGPGAGSQACGEVGYGRMLAPDEIVAHLDFGQRRLAGRRFVVSAGPTFEALDPVRFIGNRSSGKMGFAVAAALVRCGAEVSLVAGPVHLATPAGCRRRDVRTAAEMRTAVFDALPAEAKIKRSGEALELKLVANPDIVRDVAASTPRPFTVGFAAETCQVGRNARDKLERKGLDLIAANRVGDDCGFDVCDNALVVYAADREWDLGSAAKRVLADRLVEIIAERMGEARA